METLKKLSALVIGIFLTALLVVGCGGTESATDKKAVSGTPKTEAKKTAKGTLYLPGMGGHIAVVDVEIDPTDAKNPIKVAKLDKIVLGEKETNATHDVRIDKERGVAFSSAYVRDGDGNVRVAKIDLETMEPTKEVALAPSERYIGGPMYCASGQSKDMFLPVMMGYEGWIDVIDKETLDLKHRVHFDDPKITKEYIFAHGVQTPDQKQFLLTLNQTSKEKAGKEPPRDNPNVLFYMLDMAALEQGKLDIKKTASIAADATNSIAFRQHFTTDGKYLLQSARDRVLIIDGDTLELVSEPAIGKANDKQIEVHDVIPTADNKYAVLALRVPIQVEGGEEGMVDGQIALLDIEKGELIGEPTSVCRACHEDYPRLKTKKAVLCGVDAIWQQ